MSLIALEQVLNENKGLKKEEEADASEHDDEDDLTHLFCSCNPNRALCGTDLTEGEMVESVSPPEKCIVCVHMDYEPCPLCGDWGD